MQPTRFRYLLISEDGNAIMTTVQLAVEKEAKQNHNGIQAFWSERTFSEIEAELAKTSKNYALVQVADLAYKTTDGALSGTLRHIN